MKEQIVNYLNLLIQNEKEMKPYYQILGDFSLLDTLYRTEAYIGKLLNIPEEMMEYVVFDFTFDGYVYDINNNKLTTPEEVADLIISYMEEEK